ncbi:MAG: hypothetical protein U0401_13880 [Anaerolineae bacterium]
MVDRWLDLTEVIGEQQNAVVLASLAFAYNTELSSRFMAAYMKGARDYNRAFFEDGEGLMRLSKS